MLLVIDVGNTNIVLGLYEGEQLIHHFRVSTRRSATADEYGALLASMIERRGVDPRAVEGSILASVVPQLNRSFVDACSHYFATTPLVVGPGIKTGMPILVDQPGEVGADRIVNAVAAYDRHHCPLVVVDFGTATTFDAVTRDGEYLGGAIAPGVDVAVDGLVSRTAKLPRIELTRPDRIIGRNTIQALQAGLFYGYVGLVDELASRMRGELGEGTRVVATGGLASLFVEASETIDEVDDWLTLDGLRILHARNTA